LEGREDSGPHVRRIVDRVGDEHQIFPEDGHRVAVAGLAVNAYSVKFSVLEMHVEAAGFPGSGPVFKWIDPCRETP
jgi:hypothetical protein